jgi:ribosomal protein S18 acetylase RimI-like enzyme
MYNLRYSTDNDYEFLYQLNKTTMKKRVEKIWGWEEGVQQKLFRDKSSTEKYKIIVQNNIDIGAISVSKDNNEVFIMNIQILPEYQNRGIGAEVINQIIVDSKSKNLDRVWLQVFKINPAKKLYDKLGFSTIKETETHYVMELKLK